MEDEEVVFLENKDEEWHPSDLTGWYYTPGCWDIPGCCCGVFLVTEST